MSSHTEAPLSRVPTLAQYCYRFINSHLDSLESLGSIPYSLVEPVLRSCTAEQLLALEKNSPHLKHEDQDVWKSLCFRDFRRSEQQYKKGEISEPESWRKQYFVCRASEERRLEEVGSRIKSKRQEVEEEKKERQVVYTDRVPPAKRSRFNSGPSRPKTLFEKTKAESLKIQRSVYGPATLPPMPVVKAVKARIIPPKARYTAPKATAGVVGSTKVLNADKLPVSVNNININSNLSPGKAFGQSPAGEKASPKKDPMATLFMPKHRAHSQLPKGPPVSLRLGK